MTRVLGSRYELGRPLGVGGMAEIFEANDTRLARRVAIKILRTDLPDPRALERFEREARIAARFNHPNAVTIFDVGDDGSRPYLVMELIEGRSLAELLRERGPLEPGEAVSIMGDVLLALSAAHSSGIVHRDVKPGNILIGDDGRVKLADFGIAKAVSDASAGLTAIGQVIGTPRYLSPEQMRGAPATPRSDQYSAGIVMYEMLTGSIPVADDTVVAAAARPDPLRALGSLPPLARRRPDAPAWLGGVVDRAVAVDPAERFSDVTAMRAALMEGRNGIARHEDSSGSNVAARTQILEMAPASSRMPGSSGMPGSPGIRPSGPAAPPTARPVSGPGKTWVLAVAALVAIITAGSVAVAMGRAGDDPDGAISSTTSALSTTIASVPVTAAPTPTTVIATSTTATTVAATSTTATSTTATSTTGTTRPVPTSIATPTTIVDIADVIDELAADPFSFGRSGEQLLIELRFALELSREPSVGQLRKAVELTRADIVKWVAEGSLDADIGERADRALLAIDR